jgi:hypothetical protein
LGGGKIKFPLSLFAKEIWRFAPGANARNKASGAFAFSADGRKFKPSGIRVFPYSELLGAYRRIAMDGTLRGEAIS